MIHNFYLLRRSGECIIHRKYGSLETDENLVSGFLSAMFSFGRNISGQSIESVLLDDKKFVYVCNDDIIFAAYTDRQDEIKSKLESISQEFTKNYGKLENWDGNRDRFTDFLPVLDKVFGVSGEEASDDFLNEIIENIKTGKKPLDVSWDDWLNGIKEKVRRINQ
ncbi:MAG: hypothetical protein QW261_03470 [Candidatus Jordarchaeaceae archaeon]